VKRFVGVIIAVVGVIAAFVLMYNKYSAREAELDGDVDALRIRRDYLERVGWMRSNPDEASYRTEVGTFFKQYFQEVSDHLERFGGNKDFDDYLNEPSGEKKDAAGLRKARYEFVRHVFDQMREGKYAPLWTATDKGMRLDVLVSDLKLVGGRPVVRFETVLWGAQRGTHEEGRTKRMMTSASFAVDWQLTDDKGRKLGSMSGTDPAMKVDYPERVIAWFPPQMVLGYYELDLLPAEVHHMDTTFTVTSRSNSGGEAKAVFVWKLEPSAEWKLKPGEKWEGAQETTVADDEVEPTAAKKGKK